MRINIEIERGAVRQCGTLDPLIEFMHVAILILELERLLVEFRRLLFLLVVQIDGKMMV
jgi:hypothetical protein